MTFIDKLLGDMTLDEKIGQLTMGNIGGAIHSSNPSDDDLLDDLRTGRLGSLIGIYGERAIARLQRVAVEETRLHIPLIFACDVMHGYRSIFPVPLFLKYMPNAGYSLLTTSIKPKSFAVAVKGVDGVEIS